MFNLLILYFSGTGNTHYIANYIKSHLELKEGEIKVEPIETFPPEKIQEYDLLCFGFPVYACNSPTFVREYIEKIKEVENKGIFLFCTKGLSAGNAIYKNYKRFKKKGYIFLGHSSIKMPGSDGLAMLSKDSKYAKKALEKDYDQIKSADKFINRINRCIQELQLGNNFLSSKKRNPFDVLIAPLDVILVLLYKILAKSLKKKFWVDDSCIRCGTCVKICPVNNIALESNGIEFSDKCFLCMRCIHQCPQEAIQLGKMTKGKYRWKGPKKSFKPLKLLK